MQNQAENVSQRTAQDTERDEPAWRVWLVVALWLVVVGLIAVVQFEFSTYLDSDGIEHQFDMTWGDRFLAFFTMIGSSVLAILVACAFFWGIDWIGSRTWRFVRGLGQRDRAGGPGRAAGLKHAQHR